MAGCLADDTDIGNLGPRDKYEDLCKDIERKVWFGGGKNMVFQL